jgi:hypothetical protein
MKTNPPLTMQLVALALASWLVADLSLLAQSDGSGPEISVPKNLPPDTTHVLPKPNWIDQSQADADKKSRGCLECHAGVEPMHASPNVVLGCTDCHGGNRHARTYATAGARRAAQSGFLGKLREPE